MTKAELIARIAEKAEISKKKSEEALEAVVEAIKIATDDGESLIIQNLGVFKRKEFAGRVGRNPKTGESITIPATSKLIFKQAASLKR